MNVNKINVELPEISAKAYAKLNNFELSHINAQCRAGILPARKITRSHVCIDRSDKGFWHINLVKELSHKSIVYSKDKQTVNLK